MSTKVSLLSKTSLMVACFFWAASFIATKVAVAEVPPITLVTLRLLISSICFLLWFILKKEKLKYEGLSWLGRLFLLSIFGTGLHYGIQTIGLQYTSASNASVYAVIGPISIAIIAALFLNEKLTIKKIMGIGFALIGVLFVIGKETLMAFDLSGQLRGDLLVILSIFMWGIFTVLGKKTTQNLSALHLTAIVTFMGSLYMIPASLYEIKTTAFSLSSITIEAWYAIAFLGITCSFLATLLYFFALEKTESQKVGVYLYTIPPITCVIAVIYPGETIGINLLVGSIFIFFGVSLTERG